MLFRLSVAAISMMAVSFAMAVEVVDSKPLSAYDGSRSADNSAAQYTPPPASGPSSAAPVDLAQLYFQLQTLQQEVMELRGLAEQQAHELKKLKQQRLDDYLDLDRRISRVSGGASAASDNDASGGESSASGAGSSPSVTSSEDELKRYRTAIDLVLRDRNYEQGIAALSQYLLDYPKGNYAANAQYWLGQLYLQKNDLKTSLTWFEQMVTMYPDHRKTPEAKFKLGKVLHQLGRADDGKPYLTEVANSKAAAAKLAKDYLKKHY